jgi:hypothetical protein
MPAAGWSSEPAQVQPNGDVRVPFLSSSTRIEFLAHLENGKVTVSVTAQPIAPPSTMKPAKPSYSDDDDDDDDRKEEREHEDEDDHEEDEDDD